MSTPCEWCVQTSSQIDSLEYQLEQAQKRIAELERPPIGAKEIKEALSIEVTSEGDMGATWDEVRLHWHGECIGFDRINYQAEDDQPG